MIDPVWHPSAFFDDNYRDVLIDIYGPEKVHIQPLQFVIGLQHLAETLKDFSCNRNPIEQRDFYLKDNKFYSKDVWRLRDIRSMDYGFIYTQNNSKHKLKEIIDLTLENYQVIWPRTFLEDG